MKRDLRFCSIISFIAILLTLSHNVYSQAGRKNSKANRSSRPNAQSYLATQWWLGMRGGFNLGGVNVENRYSVIEPIDYNILLLAKDYNNFARMGNQASLDFSFYYKGIYICLQPGYRHTRIAYSNDYFWFDRDNPGTELQLTYAHENKLDHLEIPLIIKYDIIGTKLRPFVQVGVFNAWLINATKTLDITGIDVASGGTNEFTTGTISGGATQLFNNNYWGLLVGAGVHYHLGNIRLNLDVSYRHGMSDVTRPSARYGSDSFVGVGEAQDDLSMNNISVSFGCMFPLKFLSSSFKSLD